MSRQEAADATHTLTDEATATYETAKRELDEIEQKLQRVIRGGGAPTSAELVEEERARAKVFVARRRLAESGSRE
jgi:hypothetical protein